jgi:hypothetical protein
MSTILSLSFLNYCYLERETITANYCYYCSSISISTPNKTSDKSRQPGGGDRGLAGRLCFFSGLHVLLLPKRDEKDGALIVAVIGNIDPLE